MFNGSWFKFFRLFSPESGNDFKSNLFDAFITKIRLWENPRDWHEYFPVSDFFVDLIVSFPLEKKTQKKRFD